jgi:hypothetical protein
MQYLHTVLPSSVGVMIKKSGARALLRCTVAQAVPVQLAALELPGEVTFFIAVGGCPIFIQCGGGIWLADCLFRRYWSVICSICYGGLRLHYV